MLEPIYPYLTLTTPIHFILKLKTYVFFCCSRLLEGNTLTSQLLYRQVDRETLKTNLFLHYTVFHFFCLLLHPTVFVSYTLHFFRPLPRCSWRTGLHRTSPETRRRLCSIVGTVLRWYCCLGGQITAKRSPARCRSWASTTFSPLIDQGAVFVSLRPVPEPIPSLVTSTGFSLLSRSKEIISMLPTTRPIVLLD